MPRANCLHGIAASHYAAGRYQLAVDWSRKALAENPDADWMHKLLSCSANKLGDKATVGRSVDCMRRARPHLSVSEIVDVLALGGYRLACGHRTCRHAAGIGKVTPHGTG